MLVSLAIAVSTHEIVSYPGAVPQTRKGVCDSLWVLIFEPTSRQTSVFLGSVRQLGDKP